MIVRTVVMKDATVNALTSCGAGTGFQLGFTTCGTAIYAGLHILSSSTGGVRVRIFSATSSGFTVLNPGTCRFGFSSQSCRGGQWPTPLGDGVLSTNEQFWRVEWSMTTSGESYKLLPWVSIGG